MQRSKTRPRRPTSAPVIDVDLAAPGPLVRVDRDGPVAILTLDNPPVNILTTPLLDALADAVVSLTNDPSVRALVVTGAGDRAFSAGANIKEMVVMGRDAASLHSTKGQAVANLLERSPLPVIAAVHGFCLGGGCELSLACDFIIASDDAIFGQPEINIGVIPGWGGSRRLTRAIGVARARRWILTGEQVPAKRALEDGLLDRVVPGGRLLDEAVGFAKTLASKGAVALAAAKYAVNQASDATRMLGLEYEHELWGMLFETEDQKEGMHAFLEKRPAQYSDRADWERRTREFPWERTGNVFDSAKELAKIDARLGKGGSLPRTPSSTGWNPLAMTDVYRNLSHQTLETLVALSFNAARTYQAWAEEALRQAPGLVKPRGRTPPETTP